MTIKLVVTDMDETFLKADKTYDKVKANAILSHFINHGIVFAVASGNYVPLLEEYFDEVILEAIYLAGDDGNVLKNREGILRTVPLRRNDAKEIFRFLDDKDGYYPILSTGDQAYVKGPLSEWAKKQIQIYYHYYVAIDSFDDIPNEKEIIKIECLSEYPLEENKNVMRQIEMTYSEVSSVTSGEEWLDVYHKNGGKGEAVKFLQKKYNISPEETMCFGDSLNDLSMMKEGYYSMSMENADSELKKYCHYQIGNNEEQSVLNILEELIENDNLDFLNNYRINELIG